MRLTIRDVARVVAVGLAGLVVTVVLMELGRAVVGAMLPGRDQLVAAVEDAVPPGAQLIDGPHFRKGGGLGNLYRWFPPLPDDASGTVAGADIDEVGQHLVGRGLEPTSFGSLPAYDRGLILVWLADVGTSDGEVSVVARQDAAWWMFLHGPMGALAGFAAGWRVMRASARDQR